MICYNKRFHLYIFQNNKKVYIQKFLQSFPIVSKIDEQIKNRAAFKYICYT